jgi:beta-glucosidase
MTSPRVAAAVRRNLARAHNQIADALHAANRRYKVSIAKNYSYIYPGDDAWLSVKASQLKQYTDNDAFLRKVIKRCDFIGINYYFSDRVYGYRVHNPEIRVSDTGWDMQPHYLVRALEQLYETYDKPILITENGVADMNDEHRQWWLAQTIVAMHEATGKGVALLGYLHWSLLDNFQWDKGFWPRFGLFAVDYRTFGRKPRPSALWLAKLLKKIRG